MSRRKIDRGKPLEELVKGSLEYARQAISKAFYRQFPDTSDEWYYVQEIFADHIIVEEHNLPVDEFYLVTYEQDGDTLTFAPREDWEVVELAYQLKPEQAVTREMVEEAPNQAGADEQPVTQEAEHRTDIDLTERVDNTVTLAEAKGKTRRIEAVGQTADIVNGNRRRYPRTVIEAAVTEAQGNLANGLGAGRFLLGEAEHPGDKGTMYANLLETVIKWESINLEYPHVKLTGQLVLTSKGRDVEALIEAGIMPGISLRGYGDSQIIEEGGQRIEEVTELHYAGFDLVLEPSDPAGVVTLFESNTQKTGGNTMDDKDKGQVTADQDAQRVIGEYIALQFEKLPYSEAVKQQILKVVKEKSPKTIDEAKAVIDAKVDEYEALQKDATDREAALRQELGIGPNDDIQAALAEREAERKKLRLDEQKRQVVEHIDSEVKKVTYPPHIQAAFAEAVKAEEPTTVEEANRAIARHKAIFNKLAAEDELRLKGFGVEVTGPVLEAETGYPEFSRVAFELGKALSESTRGRLRDFRQPRNVNERYAAMYLALFDKNYKHQLQREAQMFQEAEQTTDLNLPYSVARAIMAEVWPVLVAASIFDFGIAQQAPDRLYYETYTGESGATGTVTDEDFNSGAFSAVNGITQGPWVQLAHGRIIPGTVVVNVDGGGNLIANDGTNFVVDYEKGRIKMFDGGSSDSDVAASTAYEVDYQYDAIREGEGAEIQEAKTTLAYQTLEIAADRLATDITREAIVFSRSQLNWDATTRTLANLVKKVQTKIDTDIFYMAITAALQIANNSGGTWNSSTGQLADLNYYIGVAKTKVKNRYYDPNAVIASVTIANRISSDNDIFTSAGARADAELLPTGQIGMVQGLPFFETVNFSDSYVLVCNRELVMHRVFQAMQLLGPFPKYGTNHKLVASDLYYAEEFNGTATPVLEKGSYVKIS